MRHHGTICQDTGRAGGMLGPVTDVRGRGEKVGYGSATVRVTAFRPGPSIFGKARGHVPVSWTLVGYGPRENPGIVAPLLCNRPNSIYSVTGGRSVWTYSKALPGTPVTDRTGA